METHFKDSKPLCNGCPEPTQECFRHEIIVVHWIGRNLQRRCSYGLAWNHLRGAPIAWDLLIPFKAFSKMTFSSLTINKYQILISYQLNLLNTTTNHHEYSWKMNQ